MSELYETLRDYTMVPERVFDANIDLARWAHHVPGCVVECGVWRGGMIAGLAATLGFDRRYFLFDSFEGLPPARKIDGEAALAYQRETSSAEYRDNCRAEMTYAMQAMRRIEGGAPSYRIVKGWFTPELLAIVDEPIALLRIDCDWYASVKLCLEVLWDKVAIGGIAIMDDYFAWEGCRKAVDDFFGNKVILRPEESLCWAVRS